MYKKFIYLFIVYSIEFFELFKLRVFSYLVDFIWSLLFSVLFLYFLLGFNWRVGWWGLFVVGGVGFFWFLFLFVEFWIGFLNIEVDMIESRVLL